MKITTKATTEGIFYAYAKGTVKSIHNPTGSSIITIILSVPSSFIDPKGKNVDYDDDVNLRIDGDLAKTVSNVAVGDCLEVYGKPRLILWENKGTHSFLLKIYVNTLNVIDSLQQEDSTIESPIIVTAQENPVTN